MNKIFIKPKPGLIVRKFETLKPLKPEGEWVENNAQWQRFLKTGDVILSNPQKKRSKHDD